jgi:N-acetyl-gamma-glutamyl-phosphate reductase
VNAAEVRQASLVANPGCYPTSAILGLLPALAHNLIEEVGIVVTAISGVSGAGRSAAAELSFCEINENIRAYKIGQHQHIPEIESVLTQVTGRPVSLSFVPHLAPIQRGIYTTMHAPLKWQCSEQEACELYREYYRHAAFVRVCERIPQLKSVIGTNYCDLGVFPEPRTGQLIVVSALDNLIKGAAGQAIQNMNLMFGLPEKAGLCL